jgi:glycine/D-amino acid oxidase-like deaminating enzyme
MDRFQVIVVGGGTMGTAAAWALGKRGVRALVLEQFKHVHPFGSHGGHTRVIRYAYAEGAHYVPLVLRADELWRELEVESGRQLVFRSGVLELAAPDVGEDAAADDDELAPGVRLMPPPHPRSSRASAEEHGLPFEWLGGAEVRRRWPGFNTPDDWEGLFDPRSGFIVVEPALRAMADAARLLGVAIHEEEQVLEWVADGDGVTVRTDKRTYRADKIILAPGAWTGRLLKDLGIPLYVLRKVLWWLDVEDSMLFQPDRFPVWGVAAGSSFVYGLPTFGQPGVKLAEHMGGRVADPDAVVRTVRDDEVFEVLPMARRALNGVTDRILDRLVCLYALVLDEDFVIDRHPIWDQVVFAAGSSHGFKFAPVIGEHLAALAVDAAAPYPQFSASRFTGSPH